MTTNELFSRFIAGKTIPSLSARTGRALLDMARSALLSRGGKLRPSTASDPDTIKQELIEAHKELTGGPQV